MGLICVSLLPNPLLNPHATSTPQPCSSTRSQSSHAPWCASPLSSQPQWLILNLLSSPPSPVPSPSPSLPLPSLGSGLQLQVELLPALWPPKVRILITTNIVSVRIFILRHNPCWICKRC